MTALAFGASRLAGQPAAGGRVFGPLHRLPPPSRAMPKADSSEGALGAALDAARAELRALAAKEAGLAADILAFQIELLSDPELVGHARALIAQGQSADEAWLASTAAEVDGFLASGSEMLQARAADLIDVCRRVLSHLGERPAARTVPAGHIVLADDLAPSEFLSVDWTGGGVLLRGGSPTSHLAVLARARGVPMIVALGGEDAPEATHALVDGDAGIALLQSGPAPERAIGVSRAAMPAAATPVFTADGTCVEVMVNVSSLADLHGLDCRACDGIGLARTEFLLAEGDIVSEARQIAIYRKLIAWAQGRPVRIRTVDAGLDKPMPGLPATHADAGVRGLRLSLRRPEIFKVQLRALARVAAEADNLSVMFPMVTARAEFAEARALFEDEVARVSSAGVPARMPPVGVMIEVPAAALVPEMFDGAAFFSIGSNDLFQYTMAIPREGAGLASLAPLDHPAMTSLIAHVASVGQRLSVPVGLCGDVAADPSKIDWLLSCGVRSLSVAPPALGPVSAALRMTAVSRPARPAEGDRG